MATSNQKPIRPGAEHRRRGRRVLHSLREGPNELGPVTQTGLRHRYHDLPTVWRSLNHPRGH